MRPPELDPASLPLGTEVGPWRVVGWRGRGTHGAVYRALRVGLEGAGPVALKLAVHPRDERFEREVALLSRVHHPGVPVLHDQGLWQHAGRAYPYLAMQWVEGVPLYDWAAARNPSSRQVLRLLAQVCRALEATHAAHGVHRDVKGDNVLVREADGRAFLTDFGAGHHAGAATLTWQSLPPGTPAYRSPEAWQFAALRPPPPLHYVAKPADDVFALGVTAYRLVTDEYPPPTEPWEDKARLWHFDGPGAQPPAVLNPRVAPPLSALIHRMLSVHPWARGTAGELARALEHAAETAGPEADQPLFDWETEPPSAWPSEDAVAASMLGHRPRRRPPELMRDAKTHEPPGHTPARGRLMASAAMLLTVILGTWWAAQRQPEPRTPVAQGEAADAGTDAGTVALGDSVVPTPVSVSAPTPHHRNRIGLDMPKGPLKGQRRPPCDRGEVELRGGCWLVLKVQPPDCPAYAAAWQGACYLPIIPGSPPATSDTP